MKRMLKTYYRKALAHRRRAGTRVKPPRKSQLHPINFYNLDDTFSAATILPRFANLNERIPLVYRIAIQLSRDSLKYYATPTLAKTMYAFAEEVERSLALQLSRSVLSCNCGHNAGWRSKFYNLGTKDKPVEINIKNAVEAIANLASCSLEIPSMDGDDILVIPPCVADLICASAIRTGYGPSYDPPKFKHIRADVREVGKFIGQSLFVDEAITGQTAAYAIRRPAVDWNFRFYSNSYYLADRYYTILELRYGFLVTHPEHIVKMEIAV